MSFSSFVTPRVNEHSTIKNSKEGEENSHIFIGEFYGFDMVWRNGKKIFFSFFHFFILRISKPMRKIFPGSFPVSKLLDCVARRGSLEKQYEDAVDRTVYQIYDSQMMNNLRRRNLTLLGLWNHFFEIKLQESSL